jgi:putative transposase
VPLEKAAAPNQVWAMDFMSDTLENGRKFRVFNLIDTFSKESVLHIIDSSIQGSRLIRELYQLAEQRGLPKAIKCDNGPEFTSKIMLKWADEMGVKLGFIAKRKPTQNGFIVSFNGKMRKECLDRHIFLNLVEKKEVIMNLACHYNEERPHRSLNFMAPYEFIDAYNVKARCP